jgi:hypothetical protein
MPFVLDKNPPNPYMHRLLVVALICNNKVKLCHFFYFILFYEIHLGKAFSLLYENKELL